MLDITPAVSGQQFAPAAMEQTMNSSKMTRFPQDANHKPIRNIARVARLLVAMLLGLTSPAFAAENGANPYKELESRLSAALSENAGATIKVTSVKSTDADGLLEVTLENGLVLYSTESGSHFVVGDLFAVEETGLVNLAEEKRSADRKTLIDGIDAAQMIVFSPEGPVRDYITVFTDVTCFYCQKLHREVAELNDHGVEVRYLAYPRGGLESDGARKLETAWCADDPQATLTALKAGETVPTKACSEAPVATQYQLGVAMGVRGTPAIVTSDGQMIPGYKSAADLESILGLN